MLSAGWRVIDVGEAIGFALSAVARENRSSPVVGNVYSRSIVVRVEFPPIRKTTLRK